MIAEMRLLDVEMTALPSAATPETDARRRYRNGMFAAWRGGYMRGLSRQDESNPWVSVRNDRERELGEAWHEGFEQGERIWG